MLYRLGHDADSVGAVNTHMLVVSIVSFLLSLLLSIVLLRITRKLFIVSYGYEVP